MPKDLWEHFYKSRGRYYLIPHEDFDLVIKRLKLSRARKVLDLGCGSGRHSIEMAKKGFDVSAIDISVKAIELAKKWAKVEELKINFFVSDFRDGLSFHDESFDAAVAIDSIYYDTLDSMKKAFSELYRLLKNGSILFFTIPTMPVYTEIPHLTFSQDEVKEILKDEFIIQSSFLDSRKFLCCFCRKS